MFEDLFIKLASRGYFNFIPSNIYLKLIYRKKMGKYLDLDNPITFNEKLQWLKINDKKTIYTELVDKYEVRNHIKNMIGEDYLIPLIGVFDSFDEINFDLLPNKFVLKSTHDSGGVVVCKDKNSFNKNLAKQKLNQSLKRNYYDLWREWPYKNIRPRIICEQFLESSSGDLPVDYKFHCFHGVVDNVMVCTERDTGKPKFYFFDRNWNLIRYNVTGMNAPEDFTLSKPELIDEMFEIATKLSSNMPFVRVDLYCENNKIYIGELTFYPESGFDRNLLPDTDLHWGNMINL